MKYLHIIFPLLLLLICSDLKSQTLEASFKNPPNTTRPRTWMHAMSGNMSKAGMTKDLEAIAAAGQGGILLFNIANGIPYGEVAYGSNQHYEILTHTAKECERLNLSFGIHNCDGWTSSGGPWIKPEESMKMVVWSETVIDGGKISVPLSQGTTISNFYKDIAVIAYPSLASEVIDATAKPVINSSDKNFDINTATDKLNTEAARLKKNKSDKPWVTFDYGKEHEISSVLISYSGDGNTAVLETSSDGVNYKSELNLGKPVNVGKRKMVFNDQFPAIRARYFRISFDEEISIKEINLMATRTFNNYIGYSGMGSPGDYMDIKAPNLDVVINKASIIDLSKSLDQNGKLNAVLPEGKWTVMRFGYTTTGAINWPASKWGVGLECDKFSRPALKKHFDSFAQNVINKAKKVAPNALQYLEIDSYEMGGQNWTDDFETIFKKEKGYDIIPFLPVFAGRFVESDKAVSDVTWDLNDMFCDLMTNNYYKYFTELCNANGLKSYIEPYGNGPVSTLDASAYIDLPMTEFWVGKSQANLVPTISGAHIYGKNVVSAESFTSGRELNWKVHPALLKSSGDEAWTAGVNEFMFHRFVHQANTHVKPGLTMGFWGSHIDRSQTWWMSAGKSWFSYLARGSYLLREGYPIADVLVFSGDIPHKNGTLRSKVRPALPQSLNYDCTNADVLLNRIAIKNKTLVLPEGNAYSLLILQEVDMITLPTLRRIKTIVDAGISVVGDKPIRLVGYSVSPEQAKEFDDLCNYIWSKPNCTKTFDFNKLKADFKVEGKNIPFMHRKTATEDIYFFYNEKGSSVNYECVFRVANKIPELWDANTGSIIKLANFKSEGETTRLWINLNGLQSAFIVFRESAVNVNSIVGANRDKKIILKSDNSVIIESDNGKASSLTWSNGKTTEISSFKLPEEINLSTQWDVEFLKEHGFAAKKKFPELTDWKNNQNDSIRYYSGSAIYSKTFELSKINKGFKYMLDLGKVSIVAEVIVNGKNAGVLWIAPFEIDITDYLQKGKNKIEIIIVNQWSNRLIGDENYPKQDAGYKMSDYIPKQDSKMPEWYLKNEPMPKGPRATFTSWDFYKKGDDLMPSGLLGPVKIMYKRLLEINNK